MPRSFLRLSFCLLASTLVSGHAYAATNAPASWPDKFIDPHPATGDLSLPMPCGGKMIFRPVDVPSGSGFLADTEIKTGRALDQKSDSDKAYNEFLENNRLAGAFSGSSQQIQRYYIGKYDVTQNQYAAITKGTCAPPTAVGQLPQSNITFGEAQDFSTRWSSWLLKNARSALPVRSGKPGFIRLPTDAEWSYAAKGGSLNPQPEAPMWNMGDDAADEYVVGGAEEGGKALPVGSKKPNPLGLYDMVGNVSQIVLDPYRLNRLNGRQGLSGGIQARGGDFHASPDEISTATRYEMAPFDLSTGEPTRQPTVGFRVVIAANALETASDTHAAAQAFEQLSAKGTAMEAGNTENVHQIEKLRQDAGQAEVLKREIATLKNQLNQSGAANTETKAQLDRLQQDANTVATLQQQVASIQSKLAQVGLERAAAQKRQIAAQIEGLETLSQVLAQDDALIKATEASINTTRDAEQAELGETAPTEQDGVKAKWEKQITDMQKGITYRKAVLTRDENTYITLVNALADPSNAEALPEERQLKNQSLQSQFMDNTPEAKTARGRHMEYLDIMDANIKRAADKAPIDPQKNIIEPLATAARKNY